VARYSKPVVFSMLAPAALAFSVLTAHYSNARTGANTSEIKLTPENVAEYKFGKLGSCAVDGAVYAEPLFVQGVTISGSTYNVLLVSTMNDSLYLFDVTKGPCAASPLWKQTYGAPIISYPDQNCGTQDCLLYGSEIGCLSTPVIDQANSLIYSVCANTGPIWVLRKISLIDGSVSASVTVTGSVTGTGDPSGGDCVSGGTLTFCPTYELQRSALTLANGNVYVLAGSYADIHPWHGWAFAYDAGTLAQAGIFCSSPNTGAAGLWGSSGGLTVLGSGNLAMFTGNGSYDGSAAWGETVLQFSPTLNVTDWFTPSNWASLAASDEDLSSGRAMLIPGTNTVVGGAKDFNAYSVNTTCMGHLGGTVGGCTAPQVFITNSMASPGPHVGIYGGTFINNKLYLPNTAGSIYGFSFSGGSFNTSPFTSASTYAFPGAQLSASSNGTVDTLVWAITVGSSAESTAQTATLRAFNSSLSELWNSDMRGNVDAVGDMAKFQIPVVANGYVYVGTLSGTVAVFGQISTPASELQGVSQMTGAAGLD
jgi:hypothetical protein